jgi:hypothetical protein
LRERKTSGVVLESFDAEQFLANGFLVIPERRPPHALEGAARRRVQFDLSGRAIKARRARSSGSRINVCKANGPPRREGRTRQDALARRSAATGEDGCFFPVAGLQARLLGASPCAPPSRPSSGDQ